MHKYGGNIFAFGCIVAAQRIDGYSRRTAEHDKLFNSGSSVDPLNKSFNCVLLWSGQHHFRCKEEVFIRKEP